MGRGRGIGENIANFPRTRTGMRLLITPCLLAVALAIATPVAAKTQRNAEDASIVSSHGFLSAHPDLHWRLLGLDAYREAKFAKALVFFRRAARYADKPAQGMVAEMLWQGQGVTQDRALAYAWMDLAAERHYPTMLINRERYWKQLDAEERAQALAKGEAVYAEFGDAVAKPRMEQALRRGRMNTTGSRTGFVGSLKIVLMGPGGETTIDGSHYYAPKFWEPEAYWSWTDTEWRELPKGRVDIGPLQAAPPAGQAEADAEGDPQD
jgi:hypothetical protein